MSRVGSTGVLRLFYVAAISNIAAPTVAEINAGVDLTPWLLRDGLTTPRAGATIDTSDVSSRQNKSARGSKGGDSITATFHRDAANADDDAWNTLTEDTDGYLVVARFGFSGAGTPEAPAAGDRVEVYPIEVLTREPVAIADNQSQRFTATMPVPDEADLDAAVAA